MYPVYCDHLNVDELIVWANSTTQPEQGIIASLWQFQPVGVCPRTECNFTNPEYLAIYEPITDDTAKIVVAAHFLTIAASFYAAWAVLHKLPILQERIYSVLLIIMGAMALVIADTAELANHLLAGTLDRCWDTTDNIVIVQFDIFLPTGLGLIALGVGKVGVPLVRIPTKTALDVLSFVWDVLIIGIVVVIIVLYLHEGRTAFFIKLSEDYGALPAGLALFVRLGINLSSTHRSKFPIRKYPKIRLLKFLSHWKTSPWTWAILCGITGPLTAVFNAYNFRSGKMWFHAFLALDVSLTLAFASTALLMVVPLAPERSTTGSGVTDEETSLLRP